MSPISTSAWCLTLHTSPTIQPSSPLLQKRGLTNVEVITCDINTFEASAPGSYDRVISIEMFEHMKNYQKLMSRVARFLRPGGKLFVHIFTHANTAYHFDKVGSQVAIARASGGIERRDGNVQGGILLIPDVCG